MVSSRDYGLIWDNPSKTTIDLGFNLQNVWSSEVGDRVSFFVIAGDNTDEIYEGYRQLTGITHMLPKAAYGYIQSKAIYPTQDQLLAVAKGYRDRNLPLDVLVVDFLNMTKQGEMDLDPSSMARSGRNEQAACIRWASRRCSACGRTSLPARSFTTCCGKRGGSFTPLTASRISAASPDAIGPNIDTTNPAAAKWWWDEIRDRYVKPDGFSYIWLDETEPDIDPAKDFFYVGSGPVITTFILCSIQLRCMRASGAISATAAG